jgi:hypothetical protein
VAGRGQAGRFNAGGCAQWDKPTMSEKFYSDYGRLCNCGGTIHSYEMERPAFRSDWNGKVKTFCYTCQAESEFHVDSWRDMPDNASKAAALHRSTRDGFFRLFARSLRWQRANAQRQLLNT